MLIAVVMVFTMTPLEVFASLNGETEKVTRYNVLVLDKSGSMSGKPLDIQKKAAAKFCESVLAADGDNYVGIISFGYSSSHICNFTKDIDLLKESINDIYTSGGTNTNSALLSADQMFSEIDESVIKGKLIKNIVLCSDGLPQSGSTSSKGPYAYGDYTAYRYANAAYNTAASLKNDYFIYTLGFFHSLSGKNLIFGRRFMSDLQNAGYYEVTDPDELEFTFGDIAGDITDTDEKITGTFKFRGELKQKENSGQNDDNDKKKDSKADYCYKDSYFYGDASDLKASLATMSLCLELSSWSSYEKDKWYDSSVTDTTDDDFWNDRLYNVKTLLLGHHLAENDGFGGIGFDHVQANSFWEEKPTKDSVGVITARKHITDGSTVDSTLIAVVVRGGGYGEEWASNFTVGKSGEHQGFSEAKQIVLDYLNNEVLPDLTEKEKSRNIKLWIVGYSRAGIVANMVAGELVKNPTYLGCNIDQKDIYCYTFEAPQGIMNEQDIIGAYSNIHNYSNLNDLVPYVAPTVWNFTKYNAYNDFFFPIGVKNDEWSYRYEGMIQQLEKMGFSRSDYTIREELYKKRLKVDLGNFWPGGKPLVYTIDAGSVPTSTVINNSMRLIFDDAIGSRVKYTEDMQYAVRQISSIIFDYDGIMAGLGDYAGEVLDLDAFIDCLEDFFTVDNMVYIVQPMIALNFDSIDTRMTKVRRRFEEKLGFVFREFAATGNFIDALGDSLWNIVKKIADDALHFNLDSIDTIVTLVEYCTTSLKCAHYPEICLSWMRYNDPEFNPNAPREDAVNSNVTRVIHINCPVDVTVTDFNNNVVAEIVDNKVVDHGGSISGMINENGEKVFYLPGNAQYSVSIEATDDGTVSYTVDEYNFIHNTETRLVGFEDVVVNAGDVLTGIIPRISDAELQENNINGSTLIYSLIDPDGRPVSIISDNKGEEIDRMWYSVNITAEGNGGYPYGAGKVLPGHFSEVSVAIYPNAEFLGWYKNDILVSNETTYRFKVTEETNLVAKFTNVEPREVRFEVVGGGQVVNDDAFYCKDVQLGIQAVANPGYEFDRWDTSSGGQLDDPCAESTVFVVPDNDVVITAIFRKSDSEKSKSEKDFKGFVYLNDEYHALNLGNNCIPLPHSSDETCTDGIYEWHICSACGQEYGRTEIASHEAVDGDIYIEEDNDL